MPAHKIELTDERLAAVQAALGQVVESKPERSGAPRARRDDGRDAYGKPHLYVGEDAVGEKCEWCGFGKSHDIHSTERRKAWQKENRIVPKMDVNWQGDSFLQEQLRPIAELKPGTAVGDITAVALGLAKDGQVNPVLLAADGVSVASGAHIVHAAEQLGWTHVACRSYAAASATKDSSQTSLLDLAEQMGDKESLEAMARHDEAVGVDEINNLTTDANRQWVGLAEFVQVEDSYKTIISCETEEERQALLDALGVAAAYQRKRGPVSAQWPDYGRETPTALRFESGDRPDGGKPIFRERP